MCSKPERNIRFKLFGFAQAVLLGGNALPSTEEILTQYLSHFKLQASVPGYLVIVVNDGARVTADRYVLEALTGTT